MSDRVSEKTARWVPANQPAERQWAGLVPLIWSGEDAPESPDEAVVVTKGSLRAHYLTGYFDALEPDAAGKGPLGLFLDDLNWHGSLRVWIA